MLHVIITLSDYLLEKDSTHVGDKLLSQVWAFLTGKYVGHTNLWLSTRPWPAHMKSATISPATKEQWVVVSKSNRPLAYYCPTSAMWCYGSGIYPLTFDPSIDSAIKEPSGTPLDEDVIHGLDYFI